MPRKMMKKNLLSLENLLGLVLAILIVFDIKVEQNIANLVNSPIGMVLSLIGLILVFVTMNPIIGFLYVVYLYETVKYSSTMLGNLVKPVENIRKDVMRKLNSGNLMGQKDVEVEVIERMAPLVKKAEDYGVNFQPNAESNTYTTL